MPNTHLVTVWIAHLLRLRFQFCVFLFFFFLLFSRFSRRQISLFTHCSRTIHALFTGPTATLFRKKYIKNGSHGTIHAFKNYFAIVFSVFSFQQNKLYPNRPLVSIWIWMKTHVSTFLLFFFFWPTPLALFMRHKQYIKVNVQCLGEWTVTKKLFFCCFQQ